MYDTHVIKRFDELFSLKEEWNTLWGKSANKTPYQRWEWSAHWAKSATHEKNLYILIARNKKKELVGIAPLELVNILGVTKKARFIGQEESIYPDFIILKDDAVSISHEIIQEMLCNSDFRTLDLIISEPSLSMDIIKKDIENSNWSHTEAKIYTKRLIVNLSSNYESFLNELGSKMRQEIRGETRKLERKFTIEFRAADNTYDFERDMEILFTLNAIKWGGDPKRKHLKRRACYRALHKEGMAKIFVLSCDGKSVGALSTLVTEKTLYGEVAGFNYDIGKFDLGKVFYNYLFIWMNQNGYNKFDFSSGEELYKLRYKPCMYYKWRFKSYNNYFNKYLNDLSIFNNKNLNNIKKLILKKMARKDIKQKVSS